MTAPHPRPMTIDELRAALRNAWDALNTAQRNMDKAAPRTCPWVERALAGELPAPTLAPVVRQPADRITP